MSLVRAFTTRRNKLDIDNMFTMHIGRSGSLRRTKSTRRPNISGPLELITTSNSALHDNAQTIAGTSNIPVRGQPTASEEISREDLAADVSSADESDDSFFSLTSDQTATDNSSIDTPISPGIEPNHLSCYFKPAVDTTAPNRSHAASPSISSTDAPSIPKRMPSHSKRAHEHMHKKRSLQRSLSLTRGSETRQSSELDSTTPFADMARENPFEHELQQVDEVAEDYGRVARSQAEHAEVDEMQLKGLGVYSLEDYSELVEQAILTFLDDSDDLVPEAMQWL